MHLSQFLHKMLSPVMHQKRLTALTRLVHAAIYLKKLSLTNLGRGVSEHIQERSGIRFSDRFIGNKHIQAERFLIYKAQSEKLIGGKTRPRLLVDWSPIPNTTGNPPLKFRR